MLGLSSLLLFGPHPPTFPLIPFILFTQAIPFRRFSSARSHPHPSIYPDSCFEESDSWTQSLFYGEWFPTPDTALGVGLGSDWHQPSKSSVNERGGRQIDTIMKEPTFIPLQVSGFDK